MKLPGKVLFTQGPIEFLDLIVNADYICTNSFHGTAFSIIFEKKFITVAHGSRNTRLESILDNLGILSQQLDSKACNAALERDVATLFQYDNAMVVRKLDDLKERSLKFLVEAVK